MVVSAPLTVALVTTQISEAEFSANEGMLRDMHEGTHLREHFWKVRSATTHRAGSPGLVPCRFRLRTCLTSWPRGESYSTRVLPLCLRASSLRSWWVGTGRPSPKRSLSPTRQHAAPPTCGTPNRASVELCCVRAHSAGDASRRARGAVWCIPQVDWHHLLRSRLQQRSGPGRTHRCERSRHARPALDASVHVQHAR